MFEQTRFVEVEDLRLHRTGGQLHHANGQCEVDGCSRVAVTIVPKIDEPCIGAVVRDASGTYLHSGTPFTKHWRKIGAQQGKGRFLFGWDELADDVELVRPGIGDFTVATTRSGATLSMTFRPVTS